MKNRLQKNKANRLKVLTFQQGNPEMSRQHQSGKSLDAPYSCFPTLMDAPIYSNQQALQIQGNSSSILHQSLPRKPYLGKLPRIQSQQKLETECYHVKSFVGSSSSSTTSKPKQYDVDYLTNMSTKMEQAEPHLRYIKAATGQKINDDIVSFISDKMELEQQRPETPLVQQPPSETRKRIERSDQEFIKIHGSAEEEQPPMVYFNFSNTRRRNKYKNYN